MKTQIKIFVGIAASVAFFINSATAQEYSRVETLEAALRRSVCERIGGPLVFSTRDTLFALSLPTDEPATIYLQLTVGRNGKVKEKQTKIHANHMAQYVAPAFVEAAKGLRVDRELLARMQNKDTSLLVEFPMEYKCVYDTINKAKPNIKTHLRSNFQLRDYNSTVDGSGENALQKDINKYGFSYSYYDPSEYYRIKPTPIWYYIAFIQ